MKNADWKGMAELIGIAGIIASLVFVGLELRQSQKIALNEAGSVIYLSFLETRDAVNAHPDIWLRGNLGRELDPAEMVVYENLIRNRNSHSGWAWRFLQRLDESPEVPVVDLAGFLHRYPAAREVWERMRAEDYIPRRQLIADHERHETFDNLVRDAIAGLEEAEEAQ